MVAGDTPMSSSGRSNPALGAEHQIQKKVPLPGDTPSPAAIGFTDGDEAEDLAAARAGDHAAFGRLYDRHAAVVLSLCRRFSQSEADDATQETFLRAHRLLDKVNDPGSLRPWLYAIARRVCSERVRAAQRRRKHEGAHAMSRSETAAVAAAAETVEHDEQLDRLDGALEKLDDRERLAIHLYYLEADPVRAAASALGLSRSGYYKLLSRARGNLTQLMNAQASQS